MNLFFRGHSLGRSPLAPTVPLEGSDTVQGLRTLERMRIANLLTPNGASGSGRGAGATPAPSRRRNYQRFKGPFIDHMGIEDFKRDPQPWTRFLRNGEKDRWQDVYNVPASVDVLAERVDVSWAAAAAAAKRATGAFTP
jgi:hypothetical protein